MDLSWAWPPGRWCPAPPIWPTSTRPCSAAGCSTPSSCRQCTTVDASDQLEHGAGHGLGLMVLRPGCATELWGHGGALAGYRTTAFSTKDANRQLVTTIDSRPGFVSFLSGRRCAPGAPDRKKWLTC